MYGECIVDPFFTSLHPCITLGCIECIECIVIESLKHTVERSSVVFCKWRCGLQYEEQVCGECAKPYTSCPHCTHNSRDCEEGGKCFGGIRKVHWVAQRVHV